MDTETQKLSCEVVFDTSTFNDLTVTGIFWGRIKLEFPYKKTVAGHGILLQNEDNSISLLVRQNSLLVTFCRIAQDGWCEFRRILYQQLWEYIAIVKAKGIISVELSRSLDIVFNDKVDVGDMLTKLNLLQYGESDIRVFHKVEVPFFGNGVLITSIDYNRTTTKSSIDVRVVLMSSRPKNLADIFDNGVNEIDRTFFSNLTEKLRLSLQK